MRSIWMLLFFVPLFTLAQNKKITLEDLYKKGTFRSESVAGFEPPSDSLFNPKDVLDDQGKALETRDFEASADKKRILFFNGREPIYRRSSKSTAYLYDPATKKTVRLNEAKVLHPSV
jgi:dipeptidyl-peptidase 4